MTNCDADLLPAEAYAVGSDLASFRRQLHSKPELGFREFETSSLVVQELQRAGVEHIATGIGGTGIVALIRKGTSDRSIAIRADMDALPITERSDASHASKNVGVMHACGHDGHTAILIGTARELVENVDFDGTVTLIFQPAEEGLGGAARMIEDGVLERYKIDQIYGLHNWPALGLGKLAIRPGPMMASVDRFTIKIHGRGAHAAKPDTGIDSIVVASELVTILQTIVSRHCAPSDSTVVSVTQIAAGTAYNVLPETCELKGTVRSVDPKVRMKVSELVEQMMNGICAAHGATGELDFIRGTPATINAVRETEILRRAAIETVGIGSVVELEFSSLTGEDFATFLHKVPGAYIFLGTGQEFDLHHPRYDFNDHAIDTGVRLWCRLVEQCLRF